MCDCHGGLRIAVCTLKPILQRWKRRRVLAAGLVAGWIVVWMVAPFFAPLPASLMEEPVASPVWIARDGEPLARPPLADSTRSTPVPLEMIPPDLIACTLAAEDKRFFRHGGMDWFAMARAIRDFASEGRIVSGASTITQQLIKISSPPAPRAPMTKLREALSARRLERIWTKERILGEYLNRLDYGNLRTGVAEAAGFYFQKPLGDLSLAECALLAGLPQAPSRLNPLRHPARAVKRRDVVLRRLGLFDRAAAARVEIALKEPLNLRPLRGGMPARWLANVPPPAGMSAASPIRTTLDYALQRDIEAVVREETARLRHANLRHGAVVVIHNPTGEIHALVSSSDWDDPRGGQINGAFVPRSPGSALKPFTYLLSLAGNSRVPSSILADVPTPFRTQQGLALPENYDRGYRGPVTLRTALACSLNLPAMRELNSLGGPAPLHRLLTGLGLTTLGADPEPHGLGLTLGNAPVRLIELTNAYATLARLGRHLPTTLFLSERSPQDSERIAIEEHHFHLIAEILSDPVARAPMFPPGGPLDLPFRCAVKTGTSSNFRDNWCMGYTPEFTVGVWAGNFESQPMKQVAGTAGAGPIFQRTMLRVHRESAPKWYASPDSLEPVVVDMRNGKRLSAAMPEEFRIPARCVRNDLVPADRLPPFASAADYDSTGKAWIDGIYQSWFESSHNSRRGELALRDAPAVVERLKIITPANGATYLLDPEIPSGSDKLRPVTNIPGTARWSSPSLHIEEATPEPLIHLTPGTHTLTATDPRTGEEHPVTLHVKRL